jgi:uncharacterized membrane protein YoaK (UPF0700 family)
MTGPLSQLSEEIIVCSFSILQPRLRREAHGGFVAANLRERHPQASGNIARSTTMLIAFFVGAVAGAELLKAAGLFAALLIPLALIAGIAVFDWIVPLTQFPSPPEQE